jgi:hypothetical protein
MKKTLKATYKDRILKLFYRTQLRQGEKIIDNMDSTIAKELNINIGVVWYVLEAEMLKKEVQIGKSLDNRGKESEQMEVEYEVVKPIIKKHIKKKKKVKLIIEPNLYFNP